MTDFCQKFKPFPSLFFNKTNVEKVLLIFSIDFFNNLKFFLFFFLCQIKPRKSVCQCSRSNEKLFRL